MQPLQYHTRLYPEDGKSHTVPFPNQLMYFRRENHRACNHRMTRIYAPPEAAPTKRGRTSGRTFRGLLCEKPRQHSLQLKEVVGFCFALSAPHGTEEGVCEGTI